MFRLGVDLGGTNIAVGIVDEKGKLIAKESVKTNRPRSAEDIVFDISRATDEILKKNGISASDIVCAGIGVPGAVQKGGVISFSNNLSFYGVDIAGLLKKHSGLDFLVINDANAAALGEYVVGSGKGCDSFITVTIGTGIGCGIIIGGRLYTGKNGAAAEIGHVVIVADGKTCSCGRKGCFEQYASAPALIEMTKNLMEINKGSLLWKLCDNDIEKVNGEMPFKAARMGDLTAKAVVEKYLKYLSLGIVSVVNIFQPEVISIGGGISGAGEMIIEPIRQMMKNEDYARFGGNETVVKLAVLGNDAGIIGAAFADKA